MSLPERIGLNAVFLEPPMGGLETYVRAIVPLSLTPIDGAVVGLAVQGKRKAR